MRFPPVKGILAPPIIASLASLTHGWAQGGVRLPKVPLSGSFLTAHFAGSSRGAPHAIGCSFTSQLAGSGRIANVGSLPRTIATSSHL